MASMINVMSPILVKKTLIIKCQTPRFKSDLSSFQHSGGFNAITMDSREMKIKHASRRNIVVSCLEQPNSTSSNHMSRYDAIIKFYSSINEKNYDRLSSCISNDCFIDDFSFSKPFRGKKEAMKFFEELVKSMGQNVKFCVENVCEGDGYSAAVNWHIEWKGRTIPFTRGCSFYEFTEEEGRLVIRNARVLIESPIKPGGIALIVLKNITFFFDEFPKAAELLLEKPFIIIQSAIRIYGIFMAPLVNHVIASYLKLLTNMAEFFLLAVKILIKIRSLFFK